VAGKVKFAVNLSIAEKIYCSTVNQNRCYAGLNLNPYPNRKTLNASKNRYFFRFIHMLLYLLIFFRRLFFQFDKKVTAISAPTSTKHHDRIYQLNRGLQISKSVKNILGVFFWKFLLFYLKKKLT